MAKTTKAERRPAIDSPEEIRSALGEVAGYVDGLIGVTNPLLLGGSAELEADLRNEAVRQLGLFAMQAFKQAKDGLLTIEEDYKILNDLDEPKSIELMRALQAILAIAGYIQNAYTTEYPGAVDEEAHQELEATMRYDLVQQTLKDNENNVGFCLGAETEPASPEYASPEWFREFIDNHPELSDLEDQGLLLYVYALVGAERYDEALEAIKSEKVGLNYDEESVASRKILVASLVAKPKLTDDEAFGIIGEAGLVFSEKNWAKKDYLVARLLAEPNLDEKGAFERIDQTGLAPHYACSAKSNFLASHLAVNLTLTEEGAHNRIDETDLPGSYKYWAKKKFLATRLAIDQSPSYEGGLRWIEASASFIGYGVVETKIDTIRARYSNNPALPFDEEFEQACRRLGLLTNQVRDMRQDIRGNRVASIGDRGKMARALELNFPPSVIESS